MVAVRLDVQDAVGRDEWARPPPHTLGSPLGQETWQREVVKTVIQVGNVGPTAVEDIHIQGGIHRNESQDTYMFRRQQI